MTTENHPAYYSDIIDLYKQVLAMKDLSTWQRRRLLNDVRSLIPAAQNRWNFRWVIWPLGLLALSVPALITIQIFVTKGPVTTLPEGLLSLAASAVGALAAFLAPFGQTSEQGATKPSPSAGATQSDTRQGNHSETHAGQATGDSANTTPSLQDEGHT